MLQGTKSSLRPGTPTFIRGKYAEHSLRSFSLQVPPNDLPLSGVRVLELGQLIAGPFGSQLLSQYGAEVIKIEPPKIGDPLRIWREIDVDGTSPWFRSIGRNKKSVIIDMRKVEGRELVKKLALKSDVILENFKPGTLEKWGLGPADLRTINPSLIFTRVSGYGQTGPWATRPGYAAVCEAESGFRYINGFPDPETGSLSGAPVRPNMSLGDSVAGLHAAFGTVLALLARQRQKDSGDSAVGKTVDVSIVESMLNLMEGVIPEYDRKNKIRGPSGSSITGIVPSNAYPCRSENPSQTAPTYVVIGGNGDSIYARLMTAIGRTDLTRPDYAQNHNRVARQAEIELAISTWTTRHTPTEVIETMDKAGVPVGRVVNVEDIMMNEQVAARGTIREVPVKDWTVKMQGTFPVIEGVDSQPKWAGPDLGSHTDEVLKEDLNLTDAEIAELRESGIIG